MKYNITLPMFSYNAPSKGGRRSTLTGVAFPTTFLLEKYGVVEWTLTLKILGLGIRIRGASKQKNNSKSAYWAKN